MKDMVNSKTCAIEPINQFDKYNEDSGFETVPKEKEGTRDKNSFLIFNYNKISTLTNQTKKIDRGNHFTPSK